MFTKQTTVLALTLIAMLICPRAFAGEFPDDWYYERPKEHRDFEGKDAPALTVNEWIGADFKPEDLKGQIVIIDFWATWCGPCIAAMPHNTKLAKKYADQGVKLIGVCISGDEKQMPGIVKNNGANYPNAFAKGDQVATDWPVQWYPTYAVMDREGVVRAIGLTPTSVEDVVEALLEEDAAESGRARIRPTWREGDSEKRARLQKLEEQAETPPALAVDNWMNSEALALSDLKGKVVVLDFWATWAGPSLKRIPLHNKLMETYGEQGLVIIGISATYGGQALKETVEKHGIAYPVCVDIDNKTNTAYGPNGFPDYYVIDRAGHLRIADCTNEAIEDAIKALLAEPNPGEEEEKEEPAEDDKPAADAVEDAAEEPAE